MIKICIEKVIVIKGGMEGHDLSTGKIEKIDKWENTTIYSQIFPDKAEPDINRIIRVINGGER